MGMINTKVRMLKFCAAMLLDMLGYQGRKVHNEVIACLQNGGGIILLHSELRINVMFMKWF